MPSRSANDLSLEPTNENEIYSFLPLKRGIKMANIKITSLLKHIDELRILRADSPVDVLSINETRLDDSVKDSDVYIPGYEIIRRDTNLRLENLTVPL